MQNYGGEHMPEETKTNEPEIKLPKFQIVEGKLFINGVKLPGVTKLDMSVEASTKVATINLTILADAMNMSNQESKDAKLNQPETEEIPIDQATVDFYFTLLNSENAKSPEMVAAITGLYRAILGFY